MKRRKASIVNPNLVPKLKEKVICEFSQLLTLLEKGHRLDYELILEEISLINLLDENEVSFQTTLFYLGFYLNNEFNTKWQTF